MDNIKECSNINLGNDYTINNLSVIGINEVIESLDKTKSISTGYKTLDFAIDELKNGELYVIAGKAVSGKTNLLNNILYNIVSKNNINALYFSFVECPNLIVKKLVSIDTDIPGMYINFKDLKDGTVEVKQTFFDKVSVWVYIYSFFGIFLSLGLLNSLIGTGIYELIMKIIYKFMFNSENHLLMENIGSFLYGCIYYGSYLLFPIILILVTLIILLIVKKKGKEENKKLLFWILIVQIILSVIVSLILIIGLAKDFSSTFTDTVGYGYPIWLMENIYPEDPDKVYEILRMLGLQ